MLNFHNVRTGDQRKKMLDLKKKGVCLFCEKNKHKPHGYQIEFSGKYWSIVKNDFPYEGTRIHYLLIHKKHIISLDKITPSAIKELLDLIKKISKKESLTGGSFFMRFGDMKYNGSSIEHLHAHVLSGAKQSKTSKPIMTTLGWNKKRPRVRPRRIRGHVVS